MTILNDGVQRKTVPGLNLGPGTGYSEFPPTQSTRLVQIGFEVLALMSTNMVVIWVVMLIEVYCRLRGFEVLAASIIGEVCKPRRKLKLV